MAHGVVYECSLDLTWKSRHF